MLQRTPDNHNTKFFIVQSRDTSTAELGYVGEFPARDEIEAIQIAAEFLASNDLNAAALYATARS